MSTGHSPLLSKTSGLLLLEGIDFEGVAESEVIFNKDFDPVGAWFVYFYVHKKLDACCGSFVVLKMDLNVFAFNEDCVPVRFEDSAALAEVAFAAAPAVDDAYASQNGGERGYGQNVKESDQDEFAIALLADVITQNT